MYQTRKALQRDKRNNSFSVPCITMAFTRKAKYSVFFRKYLAANENILITLQDLRGNGFTKV